jgi:hypothetical protein
MKIIAILASPRKKGNFILPFCTTPGAIGDKGAELARNLARAIIT